MISSSAQHAKITLAEFIKELDPAIISLFSKNRGILQDKFNGECLDVYDFLFEITTREAKRFRASFVYYFYKLYGGVDKTIALEVGAVTELIHAYLLIIDDFIDKSATRRHAPTAHLFFKDYIETNRFTCKDTLHVSNSIAVLGGMLLCHLALKHLSELDMPPETAIKISHSLNQELLTTGLGQVTDVLNQIKVYVPEQDVIDMLSWKTGAYTFESPSHTGMHLAGVVDPLEFKAISNFAIAGGIAFQIQDDILGMFGVAKNTGKSSMDDLKEGKFTLLVQKAIERGTSAQIEHLKKCLGNPSVTIKDYDIVREIITETGSLAYSQDLAKKYVSLALNALEDAKKDYWDNSSYEYIRDITLYAVERTT